MEEHNTIHQSLLGSNYQKQHYSAGFHSMINSVATKIYIKKRKKKNIRPCVICPNFPQQIQEKTLSNFGVFRLRKSSPNKTAAKFYSTPRNSLYQSEIGININEKPQLPSFDTKLKSKKNMLKNFRCTTDPSHTYHLKIFEKMAQNNQCLKTKGCKMTQKCKIQFGLGHQTFRQTKDFFSSRPNPEKKLQIRSRVQRSQKPQKPWYKTPRATSLPISFNDDFRPWQVSVSDEINFL